MTSPISPIEFYVTAHQTVAMPTSNPHLENILRRSAYEPRASQEQFIVPLLRRKIREALNEFAAPIANGKTVLDVGCGEQPLRSELESIHFAYFSADVQQNSTATVNVVCAIDQSLPPELISRGPFGFIVCTEVLEHVADWDVAFHNLQRLLAPGGRLLISCPFFYGLHETPHDYWRATPYALHYFGARVGLKILHQESAGDALDVLGTAISFFRPLPATTGVSSRFVALVSDLIRKAAFVALRSRFVRRHLKFQDSIYLSNVIVFERPSTP